MRFATTTRIALATIVAAGAVAPAALAGGEPKNVGPFTSQPAQSGVSSGEGKNQQPFTQPESGVTQIVVRGNGGFDWTDAAIGAAAALGVALAAAGAITLARSSRRRTLHTTS